MGHLTGALRSQPHTGGRDPATAASRHRPWRACTDPGDFLVPDASDEILAVALSAVREDERNGYVRRLEAFAEQHRENLEKRKDIRSSPIANRQAIPERNDSLE
ncbi:hypothetical protein ACIBBB_32920 [Streptomyces sp. NPDC051217]|uniref:hypothetical protein n=1 Tax=Streptomyces sp. NPDC051217 TaxID=3365644 RepID=UPI0037A1A425